MNSRRISVLTSSEDPLHQGSEASGTLGLVSFPLSLLDRVPDSLFVIGLTSISTL